MSKIISEEMKNILESFEYLNDVINYIDTIQKENNYTDEEMDNDLDVALWRAYVYNNMDSYEYYYLSEKTLAKVKDEGIKNGIWCYRYSCALVYLRRFEEALEYSRLGTKIEPNYPWGWLQLGRLCYKFNLLDEAFEAIDKGLELVPNDYEFLTLKDDIENDRGYAYANSHYINEEVDKNLTERLINIDDEELYQTFANKSDLQKEIDILQKQDTNQEIIDIINSLPEEELDYNILGKLARAYNNNNQCEEGLKVLLSMKDEGENDSLWNFRIGYSYYYSEKAKENPDYLENAKKYFERCLELNPNEPDGDTLLMWVYSDLGTRKFYEDKTEEGIEYYLKERNLAKIQDDIIKAESDLAWGYDYIGEFEKAYEYITNVISLGRDDIWIHSELGYCLGALEKYDEAIKEFKKAIEMGRNDDWIFERLGFAYEKLEKHDEALESYLKGLEENPEEIRMLSEVAWIYDNKKQDYEKGIEYLTRAKNLGRDDIWINSEFGFALDMLKKYDEGILYLQKAKDLGRNDEWIETEMGFSCKKLEKYDEALNHYLKAEELGRNDEWINSEIAECLTEIDKIEEAIARLQKFTSNENSENISILSQIGHLYGLLKNSDEALKYLYEVENLGRKDIWLYSEIAWNLIENSSEDYNKAIEYLYKAVELGRDDAWINEELGFVFSKIDNKKEAIKYFEKARFINPENDWTAYHLGKLYRKIGNIQKALELQESFLDRTQFRGWVEFELAWCYALIDEKEKAKEYLKEADLYIGKEIVSSIELRKDYETIKKLISSTNYLV